MNGWICLHRKLLAHWITSNPEYLAAWVTILLSVAHTESKVLIKGTLYVVGRGQSVRSKSGWASTFGKGWNRKRVERFFSLLEADQMVTTTGDSKTTMLTVCNYERYQDPCPPNVHQNDQQMSTGRPPGVHRASTDNKINKINNEEQEAWETLTGFPLKDGSTWDCPSCKLAEWSEAYPNVDIPASLAEARQWLRDNPGKRKTAKGMTRFCGSWLSRSKDRKPKPIESDDDSPEYQKVIENLIALGEV